jgi:catechol 2,3-dioxygenase-like lactoylglutathione lyase family enzyme
MKCLRKVIDVKLAYARIVKNDVPRLVEFYRHLTGISPVGNEDYVAFATPAGTLALSSAKAVARYTVGAAIPGWNRSVIIEFEVADVDLSWLVQEFTLEPTDQPWGNRSVLFCDPGGNLINFFAPRGRANHPSDAAAFSKKRIIRNDSND